jgi:acetyl esterase/lipase
VVLFSTDRKGSIFMQECKPIHQMPVLYTLPAMERVSVKKGLIYKNVDGQDFPLDVYYPPDLVPDAPRGAVLFVHGGSQPEQVEHITESRPYVTWCQLVAASGLIAVLFKHRTDEGYSKLPEAASDVDDLIAFVRKESLSLCIDPDALTIWTASSGPLVALRTVLRDTPTFLRGIVVYYGLMSLLNPSYFTFNKQEKLLLQAFSPSFLLTTLDPNKVAPLFVVKAGRDRAFLNESIDEFVTIASQHNLPITFLNHPTGSHGFDILNDDAHTRTIIKATLAFLHECLPA